MLDRMKLWTREEYDRVANAGVFQPDEHLELIDGVIVRKMMHGTRHAVGVLVVSSVLNGIFGADPHVRPQMPLALDPDGEPEPDVAVVPGSMRHYTTAHPTTALLVVEVADSSLTVDRTTKARIYARAGIQEYWILNLIDGLLEVHREPSAEQPPGFHYRSIQHLAGDAVVSPLAAPEAGLKVQDLLIP